MKKLVLALAALICGVLSAGVIRIMPLGDSITYGANTAGGYRLPLYNLLTQANYGVDFVGSETGNGASDLPDWDHEGHSGWWLSHNDGGIYQNVGKWLAHVETPDVVLLHIGTNDGGYATVEKLRNLILRIHNLAPKTHIVATTLLGRPTNNAGIDEHIRNNFNPGVQPMVESLAQQGVPVHFLDMYSVLDYTHAEGAHPADLGDGLHPSPQGYVKMAQAWFGARALGANSYRWYKNGAPVPGGNGPILELPDVVGPNAGTYKVLAIGPDGASFSDEATLTIIRDGTALHLR